MRLISAIHVSAALLLTMVHAAPMPVEVGTVNTETTPSSSVVAQSDAISPTDIFTALPSSSLTAEDPEETDTEEGFGQAGGSVEQDSGISGGCIIS